MHQFVLPTVFLISSVHSFGTLDYGSEYYQNGHYHNAHMRQMLSDERNVQQTLNDDFGSSSRSRPPMTKNVVKAYRNEEPITDGIIYRTLSSSNFDETRGVVPDTVPSPPVEEHRELQFLRIAMTKENAVMGRLGAMSARGGSRFQSRSRVGGPDGSSDDDNGSITVLRIDIGKWNEIAAEHHQPMLGAFKVYHHETFVGYQLAPLEYGRQLHIPWNAGCVEKGIVKINQDPATADLVRFKYTRSSVQ